MNRFFLIDVLEMMTLESVALGRSRILAGPTRQGKSGELIAPNLDRQSVYESPARLVIPLTALSIDGQVAQFGEIVACRNDA